MPLKIKKRLLNLKEGLDLRIYLILIFFGIFIPKAFAQKDSKIRSVGDLIWMVNSANKIIKNKTQGPYFIYDSFSLTQLTTGGMIRDNDYQANDYVDLSTEKANGELGVFIAENYALTNLTRHHRFIPCLNYTVKIGYKENFVLMDFYIAVEYMSNISTPLSGCLVTDREAGMSMWIACTGSPIGFDSPQLNMVKSISLLDSNANIIRQLNFENQEFKGYTEYFRRKDTNVKKTDYLYIGNKSKLKKKMGKWSLKDLYTFLSQNLEELKTQQKTYSSSSKIEAAPLWLQSSISWDEE